MSNPVLEHQECRAEHLIGCLNSKHALMSRLIIIIFCFDILLDLALINALPLSLSNAYYVTYRFYFNVYFCLHLLYHIVFTIVF